MAAYCGLLVYCMKLVLLLALCTIVAAAPGNHEKHGITDLDNIVIENPGFGNILVDILIRQLFQFILWVIKNGWAEHGIPVLDPLNIENYHLVLPAGIINLDLHLENIHATGSSLFVVHKSDFSAHDISLDVHISFPLLNINADRYDLIGDFFTALPLYGGGKAKFLADEFAFKAKLYFMQSEDGKSILIDKIENATFKIPSIKTDLTGVIGGGDIDKVVNELMEDVIFDYINRFHGAIALVTSNFLPTLLNPFLAKLDSWKYIAILLT